MVVPGRFRRRSEEGSVGVVDEGVAAGEDAEGRERLEACGGCVEAGSAARRWLRWRRGRGGCGAVEAAVGWRRGGGEMSWRRRRSVEDAEPLGAGGG